MSRRVTRSNHRALIIRLVRALDEKNLYRYGLVGTAFASIQHISPDTAEAFVKRATSIVEHNTLSDQDIPSISEQHRLQLETLKNPNVGDIEIISLPAFMTWLVCKSGAQAPTQIV